MDQRAFITGLSGAVLSEAERAFLASTKPCGLILFARNLVDHEQIRTLVDAFREAVGNAGALVLIDQEGGRVQRLRPPLGRALPPASVYSQLAGGDKAGSIDAARAVSRLIAHDLRELGITMNCTPVLDVPTPGAHGIIGDRAYGEDPDTIAAFGRAVAEGHIAGGVCPVIKHIPGHGRAKADSHLELPVVDATLAELKRHDFRPFRLLADAPAAMTAHVVYTAIDPQNAASVSAKVTADVMRGEIGFDGLLMSDDLAMKALTGSFAARAAAVIAAGSDVALHCNGNLEEMWEVAEAVPLLQGRSLQRLEAAVNLTRKAVPFDVAEAEKHLGRALSAIA